MTSAARFQSARILVVDDQEANVRLLERMLAQWSYQNVISTTDSSEVIGLCRERDPDLLLLDLHMPGPDGYALLEKLRAERGDAGYLPILVLTADVGREARERALNLGASDFLSKPFDPVEVRLRIRNLLEMRRVQLQLRDQNEALEERVEARTRELERARYETLERLALAAEYRDDSTHEHAQRVGRTAALLGAAAGLDDEEVGTLRMAAPLHDVGKIGISDSILLKPGPLTEDEYELMKTHTVIGAEILAGSGSSVLQLAERIALTHHERWDGDGYPTRLAGESIPMAGRLVAIADVFDALTHPRPYKAACGIDAALAEMRRVAGTQFDPELVTLFAGLDHEALLAPIRSVGTAAPVTPAAAPARDTATRS